VEGNAALTTLAGFDQLRDIGGGFRIVTNDLLNVVEAFPLLSTIGAHIIVRENPLLPALPGLPSISGVFGPIEVYLYVCICDLLACE